MRRQPGRGWRPELLAVHSDALAALTDALDRTLREAAAGDRAVLISADGLALANQLAPRLPAARTSLDYLADKCELLPIATDGFTGSEIRLRGE